MKNSTRHAATFLLAGAVAVCATYYIWLAVAVLRIPHAVTHDEPGFMALARVYNPYTAEAAATVGNVYGPGFAWWLALFPVTDAYAIYRTEVFAALLLAVVALGVVLFRRPAFLWGNVACLTIFFGLNVSSHSLAVGPDYIALAAYVLALAFGASPRPWHLGASIAFSLLGALAKPYAGLGVVTVGSFLFVCGHRRLALYYFMGALGTGLLVAFLFARELPYYYLSTLRVHAGAFSDSWEWLGRQTPEFMGLAGALSLLGLAGLLAGVNGPEGPRALQRLGYWEWATLLAASVIGLSLGRHTGNFLIYYNHLLLAPLAIVAAGQIHRWPRTAYLLLAANCALLLWYSPSLPGPDNWAVLRESLQAESGKILLDPLLLPATAGKPGVVTFDRGQSPTIWQVLRDHPGTGGAAGNAVRPIMEGNIARLQGEISRREYSAIYISYQRAEAGAVWSYERGAFLPAIKANYEPVAVIEIILYNTPFWSRLSHGKYITYVTVWRPIKF